MNVAGFTNWYAVGAGKLCPIGWLAPTDEEWTALIDLLDPGDVNPTVVGAQSLNSGAKLKEAGLAHWNHPNVAAKNESGWSGLPGGIRYSGGSFYTLGYGGSWWSSTVTGGGAWDRQMNYNNAVVDRFSVNSRTGFSVRCLRYP